MQKIRISTDSTADIPQALAQELEIAVLPINIRVGEREYKDGVDMQTEEFYRLLETEKDMPSTSQVPVSVYMGLYQETLDAGYEELIFISLNGKGSGSFQAATLAREMFFEENPEARDRIHIHLLDSLNYSMTYGWAAIGAARMVKAGAEIGEILAWTEDWLKHARALLVPLDLKFVKKSGRISAAAAFVGDAMGLKPAITFIDGQSRILTKIRGEKKLSQTVLELVQADREAGSPYFLAYTANREAYERMEACFEENMEQKPEFSFPLGCAIALNAGPNSIAVVYRSKDES